MIHLKKCCIIRRALERQNPFVSGEELMTQLGSRPVNGMGRRPGCDMYRNCYNIIQYIPK